MIGTTIMASAKAAIRLSIAVVVTVFPLFLVALYATIILLLSAFVKPYLELFLKKKPKNRRAFFAPMSTPNQTLS